MGSEKLSTAQQCLKLATIGYWLIIDSNKIVTSRTGPKRERIAASIGNVRHGRTMESSLMMVWESDGNGLTRMVGVILMRQ